MTNDDKTLSKSAKMVQDALLKKGMAFEVIELLTNGKIIVIK